ncbi:MAG TPA: GAF domain-containing sensor histidine kinase [Candidatus Bathyarchaeia archaeon]|nr:GAF domain-containing sensor histidine kinase [Candidatus Bathyarchaeia archaeon]
MTDDCANLYRREHEELLIGSLRWCTLLALGGSLFLSVQGVVLSEPGLRMRLSFQLGYAVASLAILALSFSRFVRRHATASALGYVLTIFIVMAHDYSTIPQDTEIAPAGFIAVVVGAMVLLPWGVWPQAVCGAGAIAGFAWVSWNTAGPVNLGAVALVVSLAAVSVAAAELIERHRAASFERAWQQEQLVSLARELAQRIDRGAVIGKVLEYGLRLVPASNLTLSLYDPARHVYRVEAAIVAQGSSDLEVVGLDFPEDFPGASRIVEEGILELADSDRTSPISRLLVQHRMRRVLYVTLRQGGNVVGILCFARKHGKAFSRGERLLARGIADQAALALHTASLVADLRLANQLKTDFVSTMSHELRTPLNVITGYADLLAEGEFGALSSPQLDTMDRIRRNAVELLNLVSATLDLGRLEAGRDPVVLAAVNLNELLGQLVGELEPLAAPGVRLVWQASPQARQIASDPAKLKMILKNLLSNALKFTAAGEVRIRATAEGAELVLEVRDTGIGIAASDLPVIFEMFRQVDGSSTRRFGGVGLGLHIVKRLVEVLGGTIGVDSEPGRGSVFTVRLPATGRSLLAPGEEPNPVRKSA